MELSGISGSVAQSGEGMWNVEAGTEVGSLVPISKGVLD
jgi:6-phosphogluconate dehydrogenase (decarboxylating)